MRGKSTYLAFDLGAESGRAVLGRISGGKCQLEEVHRFANGAVRVGQNLFWDPLRLFGEIRKGLALARQKVDGPIDGVGLSTWGVDCALLDKQGILLANPFCYRDPRTDGMMKRVFRVVDRRTVFRRTGITFMQLNTLYQVYATAVLQPEVMEAAGTLLMMPDLFNYWLTGVKNSELTIASSTQFLDARRNDWARSLLRELKIPLDILPPLVKPGARIGPLLPALAEEVGLRHTPVVKPACHDTAAAVAACPASESDFAFLSCGTWTAMGAEVEKAVLTRECLEANFTNERGVDDKYLLRKNIMGLWVLQECRRTWRESGNEYSYARLTALARKARPCTHIIEVDNGTFFQPGDMPRRVQEFCRNTGQTVPRTDAQIARCIYESLALKYRLVLDTLEKLQGRRNSVLRIVGGGSRSRLLCQLTANATGRTVLAGPDEATASGNIMLQAVGTGRLSSVREGRKMIARSFDIREYLPHDRDRWEEHYRKYLAIHNSVDTLF